MDQRKNDSFVPSITQLEDFLTEHDSNVVWLLVGKVNLIWFGSFFFPVRVCTFKHTALNAVIPISNFLPKYVETLKIDFCHAAV